MVIACTSASGTVRSARTNIQISAISSAPRKTCATGCVVRSASRSAPLRKARSSENAPNAQNRIIFIWNGETDCTSKKLVASCVEKIRIAMSAKATPRATLSCRAPVARLLMRLKSKNQRPGRFRMRPGRRLCRLCHHVLDGAGNRRENGAADQACHALPDIRRAAAGDHAGQTWNQPGDPGAQIAADQADDRIYRWIDADLLGDAPGAVATDRTEDQLDDYAYPIHSQASFPKYGVRRAPAAPLCPPLRC